MNSVANILRMCILYITMVAQAQLDSYCVVDDGIIGATFIVYTLMLSR